MNVVCTPWYEGINVETLFGHPLSYGLKKRTMKKNLRRFWRDCSHD